jgi:hypothetical protein
VRRGRKREKEREKESGREELVGREGRCGALEWGEKGRNGERKRRLGKGMKRGWKGCRKQGVIDGRV